MILALVRQLEIQLMQMVSTKDQLKYYAVHAGHLADIAQVENAIVNLQAQIEEFKQSQTFAEAYEEQFGDSEKDEPFTRALKGLRASANRARNNHQLQPQNEASGASQRSAEHTIFSNRGPGNSDG